MNILFVLIVPVLFLAGCSESPTISMSGNTATITYTNGVKEVGTYIDDKKQGEWTESTPYETKVGHYIDDKKQGLWTETSSDGGTMVGNYIDDKKEGIWHSSFTGNTAFGSFSYVNNKLHGTWQIYGSGVNSMGAYVNGKPSGTWIEIYPDGTKRAGVVNTFDKDLNGVLNVTKPDGTEEVGNYIDGKRQGERTITKPDQSVAKVMYRDDIPVNK